MKTIRILFAAAFLALAGCASQPQTPEQRVVGTWEEYEPNSNVTQFFADHTMKIYLTQEEGAEMKMHWIKATWTVSPDSVVTLSFSANGKSFSESAKLSFEKDEMWLTQENGVVTKSRRLGGDIPEKYRW